MSVLDRHFETKADLFAESVLVPFAELLERTNKDWLRQRGEPLPDAPLTQLVVDDMYNSLAGHRNALRGLALARDELGIDITNRLRDAFDDLFRQLRLMAELEAERRQWFSAAGLDLTLRMLMAMVLGTTAYDWILLPSQRPSTEQVVNAMSETRPVGLGAQTTYSTNQAVVLSGEPTDPSFCDLSSPIARKSDSRGEAARNRLARPTHHGTKGKCRSGMWRANGHGPDTWPPSANASTKAP
jgi:hypothetical protein